MKFSRMKFSRVNFSRMTSLLISYPDFRMRFYPLKARKFYPAKITRAIQGNLFKSDMQHCARNEKTTSFVGKWSFISAPITLRTEELPEFGGFSKPNRNESSYQNFISSKIGAEKVQDKKKNNISYLTMHEIVAES